MKKNKKKFFEHGAHFKYIDLYKRLIQLIPYLKSDRIGNNGNYFIEQNSNGINYSNFNINKIKSDLTEKIINNKSYLKHKNFSYDFNSNKNSNVNINNNKIINYKYYFRVKENNKMKINLKKNLPKINNFSPISLHSINKIKYLSPENKSYNNNNINNNNFSTTTQYSSLKKINNNDDNYTLIFKRNKNIEEYNSKFFNGNLSDKKKYFQNFFYDVKAYKERMERNKMKKSRNTFIDNWIGKNKFLKTLNLNNKKYFFKQKN
jgi:hypothetical protein